MRNETDGGEVNDGVWLRLRHLGLKLRRLSQFGL